MIHINSLEAYEYALRTIGPRQIQVFNCIKNCGPVTDKEISRIIGKPINTVTNRRGELVKKGLVIFHGDKRDPQTGIRSCLWEAAKIDELF